MKRAPRHKSKSTAHTRTHAGSRSTSFFSDGGRREGPRPRAEGDQLIHTNTTGSHVGSHHDRALASLELVQHPVTLVLLLVAVNRCGTSVRKTVERRNDKVEGLTECGPAVLAEESGDLVGNTLGAGENENLVLIVLALHHLLEMVEHALALLGLGDDLDNLSDAVVGREVQGTDVDLDEVREEVGRESANLLGPSSGPHESLTIRSDLADDLANLGLETHVQHAISLVQDQIGDTAKVGLSRLEHVDETAGGGDADLYAAGQVTDLGALGDTTVDARVADTRRLAELGDFLLNLNGKLTSRGKNQNDGAVARGKKGLRVDVDDSGETVCECLSGASLGNTDNVASREGHGPSLRLDGGRGRESLGLHFVHDVAREAGFVEGLDGLGNLGAGDGDVVVPSELVDLSRGAVGDCRVLLVEGLLEFGHGVEIPVLLLQTGTEATHAVAAAASSESTTGVVGAIATAAAVGTSVVDKSLVNKETKIRDKVTRR